MVDTTDLITTDTGMERDRLRMSLLPLGQTLTLTLTLMAGVSYFHSKLYSINNIFRSLIGYWGGYYRPYYYGYWYGKREAEDETAASGPNPDADADAHGWGELF